MITQKWQDQINSGLNGPYNSEIKVLGHLDPLKKLVFLKVMTNYIYAKDDEQNGPYWVGSSLPGCFEAGYLDDNSEPVSLNPKYTLRNQSWFFIKYPDWMDFIPILEWLIVTLSRIEERPNFP